MRQCSFLFNKLVAIGYLDVFYVDYFKVDGAIVLLIVVYKLITILQEINTIFYQSIIPLSHGFIILFCKRILDEVAIIMKLASCDLRSLCSQRLGRYFKFRPLFLFNLLLYLYQRRQ